MQQNYIPLDLLDSINLYETMWGESRINNILSQTKYRYVTLKDIWPKCARVKILVHGLYDTPTWIFGKRSDCRIADSEGIQQLMAYRVLNVSYLDRNDMGEEELKVEIIKPGYRIGERISKAS